MKTPVIWPHTMPPDWLLKRVMMGMTESNQSRGNRPENGTMMSWNGIAAHSQKRSGWLQIDISGETKSLDSKALLEREKVEDACLLPIFCRGRPHWVDLGGWSQLTYPDGLPALDGTNKTWCKATMLVKVNILSVKRNGRLDNLNMENC